MIPSLRAYWKSFAIVHAVAAPASIVAAVVLQGASLAATAVWILVVASLASLVAFWRGVDDVRRSR